MFARGQAANVYSLRAEAARRSWRIGPEAAELAGVIYPATAASSQMTCLGLMARPIMRQLCKVNLRETCPESGLDVLDQDGDSVEVALARQLVAA